MRYGIALLPVVLHLLASCVGSGQCIDTPDVSGVAMEVNIEPLYREYLAQESPEALSTWLKAHPAVAKQFLQQEQLYPTHEAMVETLWRFAGSAYKDSVRADVERVYGADLAALEQEFAEAFRLLKYYDPGFTPPKIQAMITGFSGEMYVSDSLVLIGLDYYMGQASKFRAKVAEYMRPMYSPEYIVPTVMLIYVQRYITENPEDRSMVADMVYFGKAYYMTQRLLPCKATHTLMAWPDTTMALVQSNLPTVWAHFLDNEVLYEKVDPVKRRYLDPRPYVAEIGPSCPGRIGQYIGWQIVEKYAEEEGVDMLEVLANPNHTAIFRASGYRP